MKIGHRSIALIVAAAFAVVAAFGASTAAFADTVKVGVIAPFSGPTAAFGTAWKQAIDAYQKQHGNTVAGHKVEIVMRDLPGPDPLKAKELFYRDRALFDRLLERITQAVTDLLLMQVDAGVDAVQIFDTSAETLAADAYEAASGRWIRAIAAALPPSIPVIVYVRGAPMAFQSLAD